MPIERIVIAGGGVAGWMAASMLARRLDAGITTIQVIEHGGVDDSLGVPQTVETMLPATRECCRAFGYPEDALIAAMRGTFALGQAISGWGAAAIPAFLPLGEIGAPIGPVAFHQLAARLRDAGESVNMSNYALSALAAQAGRFARAPSDDRSVHSTLEYGISIDAAAYTQAMKADAVSRGVQVNAGKIVRAEKDADGLIVALVTDQDARLAGDLFIDATGPASALGGPFEDWSRWLPCNRAVSAASGSNEAPLPFAHVEAHGAGWRSFAPLQGVIGETLVYQNVALTGPADALPFRSGRRTSAWQGNLIAIGGAAAVIDPVAGSQLHLAQSAIARVLTLFPNDRACRAEAAEYNRQTIEELECARDYAILFYKGNARVGEPFWDQCRAMDVPDRLAHKIALYESCGRVALHDGETFEEPQWIALFDALGYRPRRYDALANGIERARIDDHFTRVRDAMLKAVGTMPAHSEYLRSLNR